MSIERLQQAEVAAGFAMATEEDDARAAFAATSRENVARAIMPAGKALMVAPQMTAPLSAGGVVSWAKALVPSFGRRATA